MSNKIISIGYMGCKKCYLNINKEEAIKRYCKSKKITKKEFDNFDNDVDVIVFEDVFECYDIWEILKPKEDG